MKICLSIYEANKALNYSISKNQKYPKLLYYREYNDVFQFDKITYILDKTKKIYHAKLNIDKFANYISTINEIEHLLKEHPDHIKQKWKPILESIKIQVDSTELLYFDTTLKIE